MKLPDKQGKLHYRETVKCLDCRVLLGNNRWEFQKRDDLENETTRGALIPKALGSRGHFNWYYLSTFEKR